MYTLRTIDTNGIETNQAMGNTYSYTDKVTAKDAYLRMVESETAGSAKIIEDDLYFGFIISDLLPLKLLEKSNRYYVVSESGKTFSRLI